MYNIVIIVSKYEYIIMMARNWITLFTRVCIYRDMQGTVNIYLVDSIKINSYVLNQGGVLVRIK